MQHIKNRIHDLIYSESTLPEWKYIPREDFKVYHGLHNIIRAVPYSSQIAIIQYLVEECDIKCDYFVECALKADRIDIAEYLINHDMKIPNGRYVRSVDVMKFIHMKGIAFTASTIRSIYSEYPVDKCKDKLQYLLDTVPSLISDAIAHMDYMDEESILFLIDKYYQDREYLFEKQISHICKHGYRYAIQALSTKIDIYPYLGDIVESCDIDLIEQYRGPISTIEDKLFSMIDIKDEQYERLLSFYGSKIERFSDKIYDRNFIGYLLDKKYLNVAVYLIRTYKVSIRDRTLSKTCRSIIYDEWEEYCQQGRGDYLNKLIKLANLFQPYFILDLFIDKYENTDIDDSDIEKDFRDELDITTFDIDGNTDKPIFSDYKDMIIICHDIGIPRVKKEYPICILPIIDSDNIEMINDE